MSTTPTADLELIITAVGEAHELRMRLTRPGDATLMLSGPYPVVIDRDLLRAEESKGIDAYGIELRHMLFNASAAAKFAELRAAARGSGEQIRVRLVLPDDLHALRWEAVPDPASGRSLALDGHLLLSRYLSADTDDYAPIQLRSKGTLRALVAVAAPVDHQDYGLAKIKADAETASVLSALADLQPTAISASWDALDKALRAGYDIVYLVAHGVLKDDKPWLFLVDEDGNADRRSGKALADLLRSLGERRPRLVVLASCESAGDGYANALAALGPLLAQAGVPAVLAMQGRFSMETNKTFAATFFRELLRDGAIDWAANSARQAVAAQHDWWMPVLYDRLASGQIWLATPPRQQTSGVSIATLGAVVTMLVLILAGGAYWLWPRPLTPMSAGFNVAVAGIAVDIGDGSSRADNPTAKALSDQLFKQLGKNPDIEGLVGWQPYQGTQQYRETTQGIGFIAGTQDERAAQAARLAKELKADIVIYGVLVLDATGPGISMYYPEIYINKDAEEKDSAVFGEEILGSAGLGAFIAFDPSVDRGEGVEVFSERVDRLGFFLVGLQEYHAERFADARESFCLALGGKPKGDAQPCDILDHPEKIEIPNEAAAVIYVFLGALEGRADNPNIALAVAHLEAAHRRWPAYARPYISKGTILYRQILAALQAPGQPVTTAFRGAQTDACFDGRPTLPESFDGLVRQAFACLDGALATPDPLANIDVRPKVLLSIGSLSFILAGVVEPNESYWTGARDTLNEVIATYEAGDAGFQTRFRRYAGYAYARRGLITRYYPDYRNPPEKTRAEYESAVTDFRTALTLLETTDACRTTTDACLRTDRPTIRQLYAEIEQIAALIAAKPTPRP